MLGRRDVRRRLLEAVASRFGVRLRRLIRILRGCGTVLAVVRLQVRWVLLRLNGSGEHGAARGAVVEVSGNPLAALSAKHGNSNTFLYPADHVGFVFSGEPQLHGCRFALRPTGFPAEQSRHKRRLLRGAFSWWWLRPPTASSRIHFQSVDSAGGWVGYWRNQAAGVSPIFCL